MEILTLRNNNEITNAFLACEEALKPVKEFFNDNPSKNHLVCGFFMRIVQHLFHRSLSKWYVDESLCKKIVDMLDPSQPECVHENVMELYTNLVRNTRDQMYALDVRSDILNDELQSENLLSLLTKKMLQKDENGTVNSSVTRNICEILICLLSTNHILFRPSHTLYKEFNAEIPWVGGNPSAGLDGARNDGSKDDEVRLWCPDSNRITEGVVARSTAELIQLVIAELEAANNPTDENWYYILRVIIELCDTNHPATHEALAQQFEKCDVKKLFLSVWRHPRCSILHGLVQRMVSFVLFSVLEKPSPLIACFLEKANLLQMVRYGVDPRCVLPKVDLYSLRTHHIHIALAVEQARKTSSNKEAIEELIEACEFWPEVVTKVEEWLKWNLPDPDVASVRPSLQHETIGGDLLSYQYVYSNKTSCTGEAMDDFERQIGAPQQHVLNEFKTQVVSVPMTDVFDTALGELQVSSETKGFSIQSIHVTKVDMDLEENDVDESKFEAMCSTKKCSLLDDWPLQGDQSAGDNWPDMKKANGEAAFDWLGSNSNSKFQDANAFPVQWDQTPTKDKSSDTDDWAKFPNNTSTPKKSEDEDEWADFSTMKSEQSLASDRYSDWPGVDAENTSWSSTKEPEAVDPVMAGFATGVINSSLDEHTANQSEC
ncbi:hypothetical protein ANCCAN_01953 [Ancylostoma caninum]|uniref:Uncharacterized protein n=1 Tax=Ancylostoma caninum TaxID=29170 RepID=A0A368H9D6_ANCCA|nr:hypothetical protein ANCCAN_01953 [Ancylostoma caninum]